MYCRARRPVSHGRRGIVYNEENQVLLFIIPLIVFCSLSISTGLQQTSLLRFTNIPRDANYKLLGMNALSPLKLVVTTHDGICECQCASFNNSEPQ